MREAAKRVRITGQLIDATTGGASLGRPFRRHPRRHLRSAGSANRKRRGGDRAAAGASGNRTRKAEANQSLGAHDYYLRGMANLHLGHQGFHRRGAGPVLSRAAARLEFRVSACDGGMVPFLAQSQRLDDRSPAGDRRGSSVGPSSRRVGQGRRSRAHAKRSCARPSRRRSRWRHRLDRQGARAQSVFRVCLVPRRLLRVWHGEPDGAIEHFARAMRLSPLDPEMYRMQAGMAVAICSQGALTPRRHGRRRHSGICRSFLMVVSIIAASDALAGRTDQARRAMNHLRQLDPTLRISNLEDWLPIQRPEDLATFADGLRRAGLPE